MTALSPNEQHLLISAFGAHPLELTLLLCRTCQEYRCAIVSSRLTHHAEYSALILQVSGSWDALARLEANLDNLEHKHPIRLTRTRTSQVTDTQAALPYIVYVSALYQPDILTELCQFFADHAIELNTVVYDTYNAPQTKTLMLNATITVNLATDTHISWLRDQFLEFADFLNLDALIEPWRPQPL